MKNTFIKLSILICIGLISCGLASSVAASQIRTLEIAFGFTPPLDLEPLVTGYKLHQQGTEVCSVGTAEITTSDSTTAIFRCSFNTEDGTFDFTLSATYADGSFSPLSGPFSYTIADTSSTEESGDDTTDPVTSDPTVTDVTSLDLPEHTETTTSSSVEIESAGGTPIGSKKIEYTWEAPVTHDTAGFRMYMNETLLCETNSPTETTLSCTADLIAVPMAFSVTAYFTGDTESAKSNILLLDPADFLEYFVTRELSFEFTYDDIVTSAGGFRVYDNANLIYETTDSSVRKIDCEAVLVPGGNSFFIKAVDALGDETDVSNIIVYHHETTSVVTLASTVEEVLEAKAVFTPSTGEAPFAVTFDAAGSTGDIAEYSWVFGDGDVDSGMVVDHIYSVQGTYIATLTVTGQDSVMDTQQYTVVVSGDSAATTPPSVATTPPLAAISSTSAVGDAPLEVTFDASVSSTTHPPLTYAWTFGDGGEGTGEIVNHKYTVAGIYSAELTVTDGVGMTDSVETPVLVTSTVVENQLPQSKIIATPSTGACPLTVLFDGSSSTDPDGSSLSYSWNFGDGKSTIGSKVQHTFNDPATYSVSLQVKDNSDGIGEATQTVTCTESLPEDGLKIEVGEVPIDHKWARVAFEKSFAAPVIVVGPPTIEGADPVLVQIRNVTSSGFDIRLKEWNYLDGTHVEELVSYVVIEQGTHVLSDESRVEAGYFYATTKRSAVKFQKSFTTVPVVLTTISSENDAQPITGRIQKVGKESFQYQLQEEEASVQSHPREKIAYIAWQPGLGVENGFMYEVDTIKSVTHEWTKLTMDGQFDSLPFFVASMQTKKGGDPAALRQQNLSTSGVEVKIEEEGSRDLETRHTTETVGYIVLGAQEGGAPTGGP